MGMKFSEDHGHLYDVVAVSLDDHSVIWVEEKKTLPNAEAVVAMAVMRQGVEDRFFVPVAAGQYKEGDNYIGEIKKEN
jgi:hypothetical protein